MIQNQTKDDYHHDITVQIRIKKFKGEKHLKISLRIKEKLNKKTQLRNWLIGYNNIIQWFRIKITENPKYKQIITRHSNSEVYFFTSLCLSPSPPLTIAVSCAHHRRLVSSPSQLTIVVSRAHRRCSQSSQASLAHHHSSYRRLVAHHLSKKVPVAMMMMMMNNNGQTRQKWNAFLDADWSLIEKTRRLEEIHLCLEVKALQSLHLNQFARLLLAKPKLNCLCKSSSPNTVRGGGGEES
ncbi:uncharacterized protein LOC107476033 [Arachis duranensis]|uniref:Uncharacterized protein LOC107476033 n=1 Tax=Arachis duranensis TaxID=130453 RepID=A0A9C6WFX3_ARADU|nr:uncharacterized protein LOC107476033 [Arachis duranensis]